MELPDTKSTLCLCPFGTFSQSLSSIKSSSSGTRTGAGIEVVVVVGGVATVGGASMVGGGGTFLMGAWSTTVVALVVALAVALATSDVGGGGAADGGGGSAEMTAIRTMNRRDRVTILLNHGWTGGWSRRVVAEDLGWAGDFCESSVMVIENITTSYSF